MLRRHERVTCAACGASHRVIDGGQECVICGSQIQTTNDRRNDAGSIASEERRVEGAVSVSDYEWYVELAAKGLAERDNYPMPKSVTTPQAFYEVMASAALDAAGLRALLARVARAERDLENIREALRQADLEAEGARHRLVSDAEAPGEVLLAADPVGPRRNHSKPQEGPETGPQAPQSTVTDAMPEPSRRHRSLKRAIRRSPVRRVLR